MILPETIPVCTKSQSGLILRVLSSRSRGKGFGGCRLPTQATEIKIRRGVRVVEGARLESVYTLIAYRGFESLPLRQVPASVNALCNKTISFNGDLYRSPRNGN